MRGGRSCCAAAAKGSQAQGRNAAHCPGWPLQRQRCFASRCAGRACGAPLTLETSASPAGLTARARPKARPETRAANLDRNIPIPGNSCGFAALSEVQLRALQAAADPILRGREPGNQRREHCRCPAMRRRSAIERRLSRAYDQAVRIPWLAQQYERTCDDCGYVWRVSKGIAHPHMQKLPRVGGSGGPGMAARANAVVEANAKLAARAAGFRHCSRCESTHYKQRSIRS